jgi:signal peptidase I
MGDNRGNSQDSRFHDPKGDGSEGSVPLSKVTGRAFALVWPLNHMTWLSNYPSTFAGVPAEAPADTPATKTSSTTSSH